MELRALFLVVNVRENPKWKQRYKYDSPILASDFCTEQQGKAMIGNVEIKAYPLGTIGNPLQAMS